MTRKHQDEERHEPRIEVQYLPKTVNVFELPITVLSRIELRKKLTETKQKQDSQQKIALKFLQSLGQSLKFRLKDASPKKKIQCLSPLDSLYLYPSLKSIAEDRMETYSNIDSPCKHETESNHEGSTN